VAYHKRKLESFLNGVNMEEKIVFNLSPSSIGLYNESQLRFYCSYIKKLPADTRTIKIYGQSGTLVHECMERYFDGHSLEQQKEYFEEQWVEKKLDKVRGFNGKVLDKSVYWKAVQYANHRMDENYDIISSEELIVFPLVDNDKATINIKGYIDVVCKDKDGNVLILDYKTSSNTGDFSHQAIHYIYSYYRKHGVMPKKAIFEYVKIQKVTEYTFNMLEIKEYETKLKKLAEEIVDKGFDIDKYDLGQYDSAFNEHLKFCMDEANRRKNINDFKIDIKKGRFYLDIKIEEEPFDKLKKAIDIKYRYKVDGCEWSPRYQAGQWDGLKKFLKSDNSLPLGFLNDFKHVFKDFCKFYNITYELKIVDHRDMDVTFKTFNTKYKDTDIELRYYQDDAIKVCLKNKIGILYGGCGFGKTLTSAELIKQINQRTLFLINRNELINQTAEEFENYLGLEIGIMNEGNLVTHKQITIASVQTLNSILGGDDKAKKSKLITYLYNINVLIMDEAQFVSDVNSYGRIAKYCVNSEYRIGLSGSPWRNGNDTLELNALLGFPIYTKKTKDLEDEGYLVPTKCIFINNTLQTTENIENYQDAYKQYIYFNENRNNLIKDICDLSKDKKIIITTKLVDHAQVLCSRIDGAKLITGSVQGEERKNILKEFKESKNGVIVGTQQIMSTGINIPNCDIIINATANKSDILTVQTVGRVKRLAPNKTIGYFIDFCDNGSSYFQTASKYRQKVLEKFENEVIKVDNPEDIYTSE